MSRAESVCQPARHDLLSRGAAGFRCHARSEDGSRESTSLDCSWRSLQQRPLGDLAPLQELCAASDLEALALKDSDCFHDGGLALAHCLSCAAGLRELDLRGSPVDARGLTQVLQACPQLAVLKLSRCALADGDVEPLCAALAEVPGLELLHLSRNAFSHHGLAALERFLPALARLRRVDFGCRHRRPSDAPAPLQAAAADAPAASPTPKARPRRSLSRSPEPLEKSLALVGQLVDVHHAKARSVSRSPEPTKPAKAHVQEAPRQWRGRPELLVDVRRALDLDEASPSPTRSPLRSHRVAPS